MRLTRRLIPVCLCMALISFSAGAEDNADSAAVVKSQISISASDPARVFIDGDSVGTTPMVFSASPGRHILRIVGETDVQSWASEPVVDTIEIQPNLPQSLNYIFRRKIFLNSNPNGAEVFTQDSLLGTTPLIIRSDRTSFTFRKEGYEDATVTMNEPKNVQVSLKRVWQSRTDSSIFLESEEKGSSLRLYITGATTILAGAASAYFKVKADNSYTSYLQTGNQSRLSETNRYDTAAIVTIAATQLSLGLFTYFVLSE